MSRPLRTNLSEKNLYSKGVPKHFFNVQLSDFQTDGNEVLEKAKSTVANYIDNLDTNVSNGDGLYLYGSNGVGKTMLSSLIVKEAYRHRYSSKRITFVEYLNEYTKIWKANSVEERELMEDTFYSYIKAVDVLVLEEIGKEQSNRDLAMSVLEDCLRFREEKGLCTIICTNVTLKDLIKFNYPSSSIESLIKGHLKPVRMVGVDRRVNK